MKIRAAVAEKNEGQIPTALQVQDLELDDNLHEKEVLVRVVACAVCHADLAARDGHVPFLFPACWDMRARSSSLSSRTRTAGK
jgi:aryl-alcohol dehydrogenase